MNAKYLNQAMDPMGGDVMFFHTAAELRQQMVGTWSLSEQRVEQDGKKIQRFGAIRNGTAIYDGKGRFATSLLRTDLDRNGNRAIGNQRHLRKLVCHRTGPALTSRIDGSTFPGWGGQSQRRSVSILGDEMTMCVAGAQIGGTASQSGSARNSRTVAWSGWSVSSYRRSRRS